MQWIAPSEKDSGNETLENRLWAAADQLRANSGLTSAQYSQPVLGLIFLRFAEVRFLAQRAVLEKQAGGGDEAKKVARHLLERVRAALVLDWRQRAQARAQVRIAIEDTLDEGLPRAYTPDLYQKKCAVLFEHVFESFGEPGTIGASGQVR